MSTHTPALELALALLLALLLAAVWEGELPLTRGKETGDSTAREPDVPRFQSLKTHYGPC